MIPVLLAAAALLTPADAAMAVDEARVLDVVAHLAGEEPVGAATLVSRHLQHADHERAGRWLSDQFRAIDGLTVELEFFLAQGFEAFNIVADLPAAAEPSRGLIVFGAHWDSTASEDPDWDPETTRAPGADDDASGIAVLLEAATVLAAYEPGFAWDVRFVAFDAEEEGLLGSFHHVAEMDDLVDVAVIFDPVGYNPGGAGLLWFSFHANWPEAGDALDASAEAIDTWLDVSGVDQALIGGDARSDHFPFWEEGIPAIHIGSFPPPPAYHTSGDLLEVVDPRFLAEVAALATAHAVRLAEPLEPPEEGAACSGCATASAPPTSAWIAVALAVTALRRRSWRRCVP